MRANGLNVAVVLLFMIGITGPVLAETQPVATAVPTAVAVDPAPAATIEQPVVPEIQAAIPTEKAIDGMVSLDFQDADIRNVLKVLGYKSGVNIVTSPEVAGNVTIQLNDVPWKKALEVILSTYGFGYQRDGNIITVMSIENLKKYREDSRTLQDQEPLETKTYRLSYAKAQDVVDSISKVKSARGTINFDQRTNTIIIRDVQNALELIDEVIKTLDTVTPQVLIEAKVVETTLDNQDKLGIDWTTAFTASGAKRPTTFPFVADETNRFMSGNFPATTSTNFSYGTLDFTQLQAVFEMLNTRSNTNILSNPKIVTLDNQSAKIVVGTQYPIPTYTYNTEQAQMQVSGWEYKDIGIIFEVTPHINNPQMVTLELHPIITAITGEVTVENTTLPKLSVEEARTKVMIANGQTLVIAGLIKDTTTITDSKVPFLGDIPLLGHAFRKKENTKEKTELLIFLTPRVVTADTSAAVPNPDATTTTP